jgi:membrane protease YdiL (CAAX protease family)
MGSTAVTTESPHRAIAPAWHTATLLLALLCFSVFGARSGNLPLMGYGRAAAYVLAMVFEWAIVAFVWFGLSRRGVPLRHLIGGTWPSAIAVLRDLAIAIGFLIISQVVLGGVQRLVKAVPNLAIRNMLPQSSGEVALFLMLAATGGFCEEVIYRGYLQRQFAALTKTTVGGIVLQGIAFGISHGYQGWKWMLIIAIFGSMFGLLAYWRGSLRPGMLAHFLQDGVSGLVARHLLA